MREKKAEDEVSLRDGSDSVGTYVVSGEGETQMVYDPDARHHLKSGAGRRRGGDWVRSKKRTRRVRRENGGAGWS